MNKLTTEERAAGLKIIHTQVGRSVEPELAIPNARLTPEEREQYWNDLVTASELIF